MYEPPPGTKKEREREDDEPEYKFEWQRKFNAPREEYVHLKKIMFVIEVISLTLTVLPVSDVCVCNFFVL
jgi:hypothetical protein